MRLRQGSIVDVQYVINPIFQRQADPCNYLVADPSVTFANSWGVEMEDGIGCKEFARIIGANYPDVSRAATAGIIHVIGTKGNHRGPGVNILDRQQAFRIAAAVECGIPWRVAAKLGDRISIIRSGGIRIKPETRIAIPGQRTKASFPDER